jgi:hypothetical protein
MEGEMPKLSDGRPAREIGAVIACVLLWVGSSAEALADVMIKVSFVYVEHEISPSNTEHRTNVTSEYILTSDHKVKLASHYGSQYNSSAEEELGEPHAAKTISGYDYVARIRIDNGMIVIASFYPSYEVITRISTNGVDSCRATKEFKWAKGHNFFEAQRLSNHEHMLESEMRAENVTCMISALGD